MPHTLADGRPCILPENHSGFHKSAEWREANARKNRDPKVRRKRSATHRAKWEDQPHTKMSEAQKRSWANPEIRARRLAWLEDPERRRNLGVSIRGSRKVQPIPGDRALHRRALKMGTTAKVVWELSKKQFGLCAICWSQAWTALDHDHATGKFRGLLCHQCNEGIGALKDNAAQVQRAASYLGSVG